MNHGYNSSCFKSFLCFFFTRNNTSICAHWWACCIFYLSPVIFPSNAQLVPPIHTDRHDILRFCVSCVSLSDMIFASLQCSSWTMLQYAQFSTAQLQLCIACWIQVAWFCSLSFLMANIVCQYRSCESLTLSKKAESKAWFLSCAINTSCLHRKSGDNPGIIYTEPK